MAKVVQRKEQMDLWERAYVPEIVRGMSVTVRHFFTNLLGGPEERFTPTVQYPEERRAYAPRFRGKHRLLPRPDGTPRCVACYMCATACPSHCIHIAAGEHEDPHIEKYPTRFEIDELRCMYCGFCVEACPEDAIAMDTGVHTPPVTSREELLYGRDLLRSFGGGPRAERDGSIPEGQERDRHPPADAPRALGGH